MIKPDETWRINLTDSQKLWAAKNNLNCTWSELKLLLKQKRTKQRELSDMDELLEHTLSPTEDILLYLLAHGKWEKNEIDFTSGTEELYVGFIADLLKKYEWFVNREDETFLVMGQGMLCALVIARVLMKKAMQHEKLKGQVKVNISFSYLPPDKGQWKVEAQHLFLRNKVYFLISPWEKKERGNTWKVQLFVELATWKGECLTNYLEYEVSERVVGDLVRAAVRYLSSGEDEAVIRLKKSKLKGIRKDANNRKLKR